MCNCLKEISERAIKELPQKNAEYANMNITKAAFEDETLMFLEGGKCAVELTTPVRIEYEQKNKKGEVKSKKKIVNFSFHYCPFCGEKYEK